MRDVPEKELISRVKSRDKAAFAELYNRLSPPVFGLAQRMLRESAAAEDVLQETFLVFWNKTAYYDPGRGALLSWLFAVCRNACLDRLKKPAQKREVPVSNAILSGFQKNKWDYEVTKADYAEIHEMISAALATLKPKEREMVELAFFSGLSHSEIAAQTQVPLGSVKSLISASLKKLRGEIRENWQYDRSTE